MTNGELAAREVTFQEALSVAAEALLELAQIDEGERAANVYELLENLDMSFETLYAMSEMLAHASRKGWKR